jgi:hypothetical protein
MATCPRCKGHLTDGHRCPHRRSLVAAEIIACAIGGGLLAWLTLIGFDPHGQVTDMDAISFIAGALVAVGINRALRS